MNERIDQLWGQALDAAVPETYTRLSYSQVLKIKQVFAELIVQECADKVDSSLRDWLHDNSGGTMGDKLKEHFGVEE
jgi:hypothetical protein